MMELLIVFASLLSVSLGATLTDSHARAELAAKGISVSSAGNCHDKQNERCTSLDGLQLVSFTDILKFAQMSGCKITITAGTEAGHASGPYSHGSGYKLDISDTSCVTSYITRNFKHTGTRDDSAALYADSVGNVFAHESWEHSWDITWYNYYK